MEHFQKQVFFIFLKFIALLIASLFVYQKGFFIIKDILPDISEKTEFVKPQANKVVLVIIDALRFDFTQKFEENEDGRPLEHFKNKLTVIHELMESQPNNTIHLLGYSDPPTATTQRIKGITIGNLPSFIEIAATFTFSQREEDNLLLQLQRNHLEVSHLGDDVWTGLFSNQFTRDFYADSLDIFDFHSTDNVVINHLQDELKEQNLKLLIAHFNGVDHVGHALNSNHEQMTMKLKQMDEQLRIIINKLEDSDVLILMGDHGMSESGHHGGSTKEETSIAMFAYSKQGFKKEPKINNYDPKYEKSTNQIDILATISMLLGIPIPYNNLGLIINDFYAANTPNENIFKDYHYNLKQIYSNIAKVQSISGKMTDQEYSHIANKFEEMEEEFKTISDLKSDARKEELELQYIVKVKKFQQEIKDTCRRAWNQLNIPIMLIGNTNLILCTALCILISVYIKILLKHKDKSQILHQQRSNKFGMVIQSCAVMLGILCFIFILELSVAASLGFFLVLVQTTFGYSIIKDIYQILLLIKKKEEHIIISFPSKIINRRLVCFFIYCGFQAYTMNSLHAVRSEDMMIWYAITIGVFVDCSFLYYDHKLKDLKTYFKLFSIPIVLYLAQYFDVTSSRIYVLAQTRFETITRIMSLFKNSNIFFPAIAFFFYLSRKKIFVVNINKNLFLANFITVTIYFVLQDHTEHSLVSTTNVYIARISYALMLLNVYFLHKHKQNYIPNSYIYAQLINLNVTLLMLINQHSFYLCLIFYYVFETYHSYAQSQGSGGDITTFAFLFSLIQYFYLISGHKSEITSLQVQSAYVGFEKYNLAISGYLLATNQYSFQIIGYFLVQFVSNSPSSLQSEEGEEKTRSTNNKSKIFQNQRYQPLNQFESEDLSAESKQAKENGNYFSFLIYLVLMVTATSINCTFNHDSLFMPSEFGPRFLFDLIQITHALIHIMIILVINNCF